MKKFLKKLIEKTGYGMVDIKTLRYLRLEKPISRDDFFNLYFSTIPNDFFFVQIGANDGISSDPLHQYIIKYGLSGMVVEPQLKVFDVLKKTYDGCSIICVNVAIGKGEITPFYFVDSAESKMTGLASFRRDVIRKNLNSRKKIPRWANPEDYIQTVNIKTITFEELTRDIKKIDFLQIDCEGYDYEIIKMIDFNRFSPQIINYESSHLSEDDKKGCVKMLVAQGYDFFNFGSDTCAYKI